MVGEEGGWSGGREPGAARRRPRRRGPYAAGMGELIPLFPLGTPLFPGVVLPLQIFEPRYRRLMRDLAGPARVRATAASSASSPSGRAGRSSRSRPPRRSTTSAAPPGSRWSARSPTAASGSSPSAGDRFRLLDVVVGEDPPYLQAEVEWLAEEEAAEEAAGDSDGLSCRRPHRRGGAGPRRVRTSVVASVARGSMEVLVRAVAQACSPGTSPRWPASARPGRREGSDERPERRATAVGRRDRGAGRRGRRRPRGAVLPGGVGGAADHRGPAGAARGVGDPAAAGRRGAAAAPGADPAAGAGRRAGAAARSSPPP